MAAKALGEAGAGGKAALPGMLALLRDVTKAKSREALIVSLEKIGPEPKAFLEALLIVLQDDGKMTGEKNNFILWEGRAKAIVAVGNLGPAAKEAAPVLCALLKDGKVRADGMSTVPLFRALGKIEPDPKDVLPVFDAVVAEMRGTTPFRTVNIARMRITKDPELIAKGVQNIVTVYKGGKGEEGGPGNRAQAIQDLEELGPLAKAALPDIAADLEDANVTKRQERLRLLLKLGPEGAKEARPLALHAAANKDYWESDVKRLL